MLETKMQPGISRDSVADDPGPAIGIIAELKANAALFSAFAFGSLNLPAPLIESTSKVILSQGVTVTSAKPIPDSVLLEAFVLLDTATLCSMLVCVAASQLLIYRLADGSYGTVRYSTDDTIDRRDTALGRLVNQYRAEVRDQARTLWPSAVIPSLCRSTLVAAPIHAPCLHVLLLSSPCPLRQTSMFHPSVYTRAVPGCTSLVRTRAIDTTARSGRQISGRVRSDHRATCDGSRWGGCFHHRQPV